MSKQEIENRLNSSMTVSDLRAELAMFDDDTPVLFVCDYGDHCHTQQALQVEQVEQHDVSKISRSSYSQSGLSLDKEDETDEGVYCEECDEQWEPGVVRCPKCNGSVVDFEGNPVDPEAGEAQRYVIILRS